MRQHKLFDFKEKKHPASICGTVGKPGKKAAIRDLDAALSWRIYIHPSELYKQTVEKDVRKAGAIQLSR